MIEISVTSRSIESAFTAIFLTATLRPLEMFSARYTSPAAPSPIFLISLYRALGSSFATKSPKKTQTRMSAKYNGKKKHQRPRQRKPAGTDKKGTENIRSWTTPESLG